MYLKLATRVINYIFGESDDIHSLERAINSLSEGELDDLHCKIQSRYRELQNDFSALIDWAESIPGIEIRPRLSNIFIPNYAPFRWLLSMQIKPSREIAVLMLAAYGGSMLANACTYEAAINAWEQRFFALDQQQIDAKYRPTFCGYRQRQQRLEQIQQMTLCNAF